jgi:ABC-2 type transport system permease protein
MQISATHRSRLPAINWSVVRAIAKRDLRRYFTNPAGYVFVTLFVFLSAAAAFWPPRFFLNNLANLDQLNDAFGYLLMLFVPAVTMATWSEERKQGTDELLLTLPATALDLVLGKAAAVMSIYLSSLILSLSQILVLIWLGSPDPGLIAASYVGYAVMGVALVPVALTGSLLTANGTIAFVIGALLCAALVATAPLAAAFSHGLGEQLASFGVIGAFTDFARGVISARSVVYFLSVCGWFLYLNVLILAARHTPPDRRSSAWAHGAARAASAAAILGALVVFAGRTHVRFDWTRDRVHSLSEETKQAVITLPVDRPVAIQVFLSPDVPESYVQTRETLLDVLREIAALGRGKVNVAIQPTDPYSDEARLARERFGINPRQIEDAYSGETYTDVFLGLSFTSGPDEQVIPFLERGLSVEYEVTRAIRTVSRGARKRIGVIDSDTKMFGGVDYADNLPRPPWQILTELRKQYEVLEIEPATPVEGTLDVLIVVLPSRLSQSELDLVEARIRQGTPTIVLVDPLPALDIRLAPAAQMAGDLNPYAREATAIRNYGDVRKFLIDFGVNWVPARIAWDSFNPHPDMSDLPRETVFVARGNGNPRAFSPSDPSTSGLQELVLLYPGYLIPTNSETLTVEPLLQTGTLSGFAGFFDLVRPSPEGYVVNPTARHEPQSQPLTLAVRVRPKNGPPEGGASANVIVIADLDIISDYFFGIRAQAPVNATFDNITFFLNAIDLLAGDEPSIALRNRRTPHRTLDRVERQTRSFMERRTREEQQAEKDASAATTDARNRVSARVQEIQARRDLDDRAKQIMIRTVQEVESRRLQTLETNIDQVKNARIRASRETMESEVRRIRTAIRLFAVILPPVPVLLIGIVIFVGRERRARESARAMHRLSHAYE